MEIFKRAYRGFISRLPSILIINVSMLLILAVLIAVLGEVSFSSYVKEMAMNILSVKEVIVYITILAIYGFVLELLLRKIIQDRLLSSDAKWIRALAVIIPVILYTLIHSRYGLTGVIYGLATGLFLSLYYLKRKDWLTFSLWHMCWGVVIVPLSMAICVFVDSQVRNDFLFSYKKKHILKEKMYYREAWGWVDKVHYRPDHFDHLMHALENSKEKGQVEIEDGWVTPLKISVRFSAKYEFTVPKTAREKWGIVTGMMLHFMRLNETVQEESPWYHGNQLSAWQFDDMSSALLCSLDRYPGEKVADGIEVKSTEKLLQIWEKTGEKIVGFKMKEDESWALLEDGKRIKLKALVEAQKKNWSVVKAFNSND